MWRTSDRNCEGDYPDARTDFHFANRHDTNPLWSDGSVQPSCHVRQQPPAVLTFFARVVLTLTAVTEVRSVRMWYNRAGMARHGVIATLLVIVALQLMGGILFATVCVEPCPDDGPARTCPPICALCASCTHAQQAIVRNTMTLAAIVVTPHVFGVRPVPAPSQPAADIFHVPLLG